MVQVAKVVKAFERLRIVLYCTAITLGGLGVGVSMGDVCAMVLCGVVCCACCALTATMRCVLLRVGGVLLVLRLCVARCDALLCVVRSS